MENNEVFDQERFPTPIEGSLTTESKAALTSAAKWAKFLSIVDFVFWGQFILCLLLWVVNSSGNRRSVLVYACMCAGAMLPFFLISLYRFNFAKKAKNEQHTEALKYLNDYFRLRSRMTILFLTVYLSILASSIKLIPMVIKFFE